MQNPHHRYFIELQPRSSETLSRSRATEARRELALHFIGTVRAWLEENDLTEKVSTLGVTLFGQIQITCEAAVINLIRHQDIIDIAAIRQGPAFVESRVRWNEAR